MDIKLQIETDEIKHDAYSLWTTTYRSRCGGTSRFYRFMKVLNG